MLLRDASPAGNRSARTSKEQERLRELRSQFVDSRQLKTASETDASRSLQDRLVVMVRDPYWLHAYWELNPRSVERAQSALGQHWHATRPVLRLFRVAADGAAELHAKL